MRQPFFYKPPVRQVQFAKHVSNVVHIRQAK
ncbi:hypothetical protein D046_5823A, partial [Vibrio parahaemolyticus V-223/04]